MLKFRKLALEDKQLIESYYYGKNIFSCDYCFTDLFMWSRYHRVMLCESDGWFYLYSEDEGMEYFLAPMSREERPIRDAIERLAEYCRARDMELSLVAVPPFIKQKLEAEMPSQFNFVEGRDNADYIYTRESLAELKGKRLHGKRNHINRFMEDYANSWSFEPLCKDNIHRFFDFQLKWSGLDDEFLGELQGAAAALKNFEYLGIRGGILNIDGEAVAVSFGSKMDDSMIVHIEKATPEIQGAYQMINQQFVLNCCSDVLYINREEDMGIEGLRKAKLSYHPAFLGENYEANYKG